MDIEAIMEENAQRELLEFLTRHGYLEDPAHGIALRVMTAGERSLSDKQRLVFENYVKKPYFSPECKLCFQTIPRGEIIGALDNGGYCGPCDHRMAKDD